MKHDPLVPLNMLELTSRDLERSRELVREFGKHPKVNLVLAMDPGSPRGDDTVFCLAAQNPETKETAVLDVQHLKARPKSDGKVEFCMPISGKPAVRMFEGQQLRYVLEQGRKRQVRVSFAFPTNILQSVYRFDTRAAAKIADRKGWARAYLFLDPNNRLVVSNADGMRHGILRGDFSHCTVVRDVTHSLFFAD